MSIRALSGALSRNQVVQTPQMKCADEDAKAMPAKISEAQSGHDPVTKIGILT